MKKDNLPVELKNVSYWKQKLYIVRSSEGFCLDSILTEIKQIKKEKRALIKEKQIKELEEVNKELGGYLGLWSYKVYKKLLAEGLSKEDSLKETLRINANRRELAILAIKNEDEKKKKERIFKLSQNNKGKRRNQDFCQKASNNMKNYFKNNPEIMKERNKKASFTRQNKNEFEKQLTKIKQSQSLREFWRNNKNSDVITVRNKKLSEVLTGKTMSIETKQKLSKTHTGMKRSIESKVKRAETRQRKIESGENVDLRCKFYKVDEYRCQGRWEKAFIEHLIKTKQELPLKRSSFIKTDIGVYHPDFEFKDYFIEIKSPYTFKVFKGETLSADGVYTTSQLDKIILNNRGKNNKPVYVITFDLLESFTKIINLKFYRF